MLAVSNSGHTHLHLSPYYIWHIYIIKFVLISRTPIWPWKVKLNNILIPMVPKKEYPYSHDYVELCDLWCTYAFLLATSDHMSSSSLSHCACHWGQQACTFLPFPIIIHNIYISFNLYYLVEHEYDHKIWNYIIFLPQLTPSMAMWLCWDLWNNSHMPFFLAISTTCPYYFPYHAHCWSNNLNNLVICKCLNGLCWNKCILILVFPTR